MEIAVRLTRLPRPFDPERGAEGRAHLPDVPEEVGDLLAGAAGSSPYLAGLIASQADWLAEALNDPEAALATLIRMPTELDPKEVAPALRMAKRRLALLTALMDLGGIWTLEEVTGALSDFAAAACDAALRAALTPLLARGKIPGQGPDDVETAAGMTVLAMGKMGARELNYSSDIDLICLFDQERFDPSDQAEARAGFIRATRTMTKTLSEVTAEGYVFRTDLRLRPDPSVTPVCIAMDAAESYYESFGRTWERAAYIKAHPAAGDRAAGAGFLDALRPFVWRKHLDFAAIEDAHAIRLAIREQKARPPAITLPDHDMKLDRGGIREIEFYAQTRQLIAGGRDPTLRVRGTVAALARLADADWIPRDVAEELSAHYRFHREIEHRLQMVQDARTHALPRSEGEFDRLACLCGTETATLKAELFERLSAVHARTEGFFAPTGAPVAEDAPQMTIDPARLTRWASYPALRSPRARALLDRIQPELEHRLARASRPDEALAALERFLAGLPAGVQLLALFEANPALIDLVLDVVATSPALAEHLAQNAQVLDAVIGGGFFAEWPGTEGLAEALQAQLDPLGDDYEGRLDTARRWMKEWHFRVGVHLLRGLVTAEEAGAQYADLARAVLRTLWPVVQENFAERHGAPPGRGAVLLGMGAVGAGRMNARSDLDLIVIYDAAGEETSDGPRELPVRTYYTRLTQALITALSAPMAEGRLYEVDMRLRPSGNQGPVATSWSAFRTYQTEDAWTWEHLALTRARVVAGPEPLGRDVDAFRRDLISRPRDKAALARDVADMRERIAAAKPPASWLDIKAGPGRMQDIELLAQAGQLLDGSPESDAAKGLSAGLEALRRLGALSAPEDLVAAHALQWRVHAALRLLGTEGGDPDALGGNARDFLLRLGEAESLADLQSDLERATSLAEAAVGAALDHLGKGAADGGEG